MVVPEYGVPPPPELTIAPAPGAAIASVTAAAVAAVIAVLSRMLSPLVRGSFSYAHEATCRPARAHRRHAPCFAARDTYLALTDPGRTLSAVGLRLVPGRGCLGRFAAGLFGAVETEPHGLGGGFAAGVDVELAQDRGHVVVDGLV